MRKRILAARQTMLRHPWARRVIETRTSRSPVVLAPIPTFEHVDGTLAADPTDYAVINVYKADGLGGTHVLVGSYDTRAANQGAIAAGVPAVFSLSVVAGALNLLETDVMSYEVTKAASGKVVPVGVLTVIGKVI